MNLQDLAQHLTINIAECLEERFMDDETLYCRFLRKLLAMQDFALLEQAVQAECWPEALRYAHNLKGVCANLGLGKLQAEFAAVVALLRTPALEQQQVQQRLGQVRSEWQKTLNCIKQLEG